MKQVVFFLFWSVVVITARGQAVLQGRVIDAATREPLESAVITVKSSTDDPAGQHVRSVLTDKQGGFRLKARDLSDSFSISFVGYRPVCLCASACCTGGSCCADGRCGQPGVYALERQYPDLKSITIQPSPHASFHTMERVDLGLRPVNSAQDLLRLVPGLFIGQHQGGGLAEHLFLRGFDADHGTDVNVSVDGMPLNLVSHIHGQGFADLHFLIPELVSKFDYGKGPYYAEYGDFATAGYVAFHTLEVPEHNEVKVEGGEFHTGRVMAILKLLNTQGAQHRQNAWVAGEAAYSDGPFDWQQHLGRLNLFGKYQIDLGVRTRLSAIVSTYEGAWRSSGEIPERAVKEGLIGRFGYIDSLQGGKTGRTNLMVRLKTTLSSSLMMEHQVWLSHYYFDLHYDPTFFVDDSVNGDHLRQQEHRNEAGYNGRLSQHAWFQDGSDLLSAAGIGAKGDFIGLSRLSHTSAGNSVLDDLQFGVPREYAVNGYVDENFHHGRWLFNAGVRLDGLFFSYHDNLNGQQPPRQKWMASPKFNLSYTFNPGFQVYAKAGRGFHSNDAKVVVGNSGIDVLPAAYGTDLGIYWKPAPRLLLNAAIWTLTLQQEFTYNADEGTMDPGDKTLRHGLDLSARYQLTAWLFAHLDLNYCHARDLQANKGEDYLPLAVPFSSTGGLDFRLPTGLHGGVGYRYMADRPANADNSLIARGYFVADLTVNYTRSHWEAGLEIQNLFNARWRENQFETISRLRGEPAPVDDLSFTPGTPLLAKLKMGVFF